MKRHIRTLFDKAHRWWTAGFLLSAALLIAGAGVIGTTDNPPGLAMLTAGMMLLFLAFVHPWKKPSSYTILAGACAAVILVIYIVLHIYASFAFEPGIAHTPTKTEGIIEAILFITILFICAPGIVVGIAGALVRGILEGRKKTEMKGEERGAGREE